MPFLAKMRMQKNILNYYFTQKDNKTIGTYFFPKKILVQRKISVLKYFQSLYKKYT